MYESKYHVPIPILNNGYYGGLDELIKSYDLGDYIKVFELLLSSFSVIEGHNKQCTEAVTTCNTPCVHFSHNGVAARNCIAITDMNKHSAISCP